MAKVSTVVVSHSRQLAEGVVELINQTKQEDVIVVAAGGTEDGEIGTSPDLISEALKKADSQAGTVVLFDLGSALMNTEMALDMLDELEGEVVIADAPIVEGAYVAVVEAGMGKTLQEVQESVEKAKKWNKKT
ncbi:dihydroxyacetone kinase phosphoryl donor subunit DhaM [Sinobaca sp. H24]|uniref:dihydroxyacetone kinase phosphoryl donor subunit DhaM n=1 Tax=Sinobaca sp. H24 TaxID=2923376 RepID=UPI00207934DA|nr:dihydroxyacetone kinase phosphoryl donor subunit DhaM [Sinobaca sp. H24]